MRSLTCLSDPWWWTWLWEWSGGWKIITILLIGNRLPCPSLPNPLLFFVTQPLLEPYQVDPSNAKVEPIKERSPVKVLSVNVGASTSETDSSKVSSANSKVGHVNIGASHSNDSHRCCFLYY